MSTASKEKIELGRMEAVQRLHTVAKQIEEGKILLGDKAFKIPERLHLEIKGENEELAIELKWKAPVR
jgi:amphi-Trp domain-containing protein